MALQNKNTYRSREFEKEFTQTAIYEKILNDSDMVLFHKHYDEFHCTPRKKLLNRIAMVASHYYIAKVMESNPEKVYDLGCGINYFKKYYDNIIGVAGEPEDGKEYFGDMHQLFSHDFAQDNAEIYDAIITVCALHFIHITDVKQRIEDIIFTLKSGGRAYISLNLDRMLDRSLDWHKNQEREDIVWYVRQELDKIQGVDWIVVDIDAQEVVDDYIDGNIRLVLEKK